MSVIPAGFSQHTVFFAGSALPNGAAVTYGADWDAGLSLNDEADLATQAWNDNMLENQSSVIALQGVLVKRGPNADGPSVRSFVNILGGVGTAAISPSVCALIKKGTALGGRKHRGRMYIPGMVEANVGEAGLLGVTYRTDLQTDVAQWGLDLSVGGVELVILHNDNTTPTPVTALTVDALTATQRRRLRG